MTRAKLRMTMCRVILSVREVSKGTLGRFLLTVLPLNSKPKHLEIHFLKDSYEKDWFKPRACGNFRCY